MVILENDQYVVSLPEHGIRQDFNPHTGAPFVSQAEAQAYEDTCTAGIESHQDAAAAAVVEAQQAALSAQTSLSVTADKSAAAVGVAFSVSATLKDGHGNVVPSNDTFAVPIQDDSGAIVKVKTVTLVNGVATVGISFDKSGYYRITEECMNRKLTSMHIHLPTAFELTVYE